MPAEYNLVVKSSEILSPNMRSIVLTGEDLETFPPDQESGYVKVVFPLDAETSVMRSYTIRAHNRDLHEITLDFVDHGDAGPASKWARNTSVGETITVRGPGEKKLADPQADWFLIAGDLSALPAITVNLEQLPEDARGYAVIEVPDSADQQALQAPAGMEIQWVVNPDHSQANIPLVQAIRSLNWLPGTPYPWFAGEFEGMRQMRQFLRHEKGIDKKAMYLSCYWKYGDTDEGMKAAKRLDAQANG
ncbi:MAG: siderophore-interacting protein [Pseudomonadota bacterium]